MVDPSFVDDIFRARPMGPKMMQIRSHGRPIAIDDLPSQLELMEGCVPKFLDRSQRENTLTATW
jgi:hypothetical protein